MNTPVGTEAFLTAPTASISLPFREDRDFNGARMIKFGIMSRHQIRAKAGELRSSRRSWPFVAHTILKDFDENLTGDDELMLALVYGSIPGGPHVRKGTSVYRYATFDGALVEEIEKTFPPGEAIRIHDMAASNGITSLELFERLKHRENISIRASDYYDALSFVSFPGSNWQAVFDAEGRPLQIVGKRMVIPAIPLDAAVKRKYPLIWIMQKILLMTVLPRAARILKDGADKDGAQIEKIQLFHPKCLAASRSDPRFTLDRDDLFAPAAGSYEVIRVMGVDNFLPADRIEPMFRAVAEHIVEGGLLVVSSHIGESRRAKTPTAIFQRHGGRLTLTRDLDPGYPYKDLLTGLDLTT
jgi:hypothetical protein